MKAAVLGSDGLKITDVEQTKPGPDEVLIKVRCCGLNRADLGMRAGHSHGSAGGQGAVLGLECAGEVVGLGAQVTDLQLGESVMAAARGSFAEYVSVDRGRVHRLPSGVALEQAACFPVALQTMHDAIVTHGQLSKGQNILIQGASSGVGLMAMQIAREMGAGQIIGSSTDAGRRARLAEFGADAVIDSRDAQWPQQVLDMTDGKGVDIIIDQLSGSVANQNLQATRILGRIINVGRLAGTSGEFDFDLHALRRISYVGVTFRTRSTAEVTEINRRMMADLAGALNAGRLRLPIDRRFAFAQINEALDHMQANAHFGKLVLDVS